MGLSMRRATIRKRVRGVSGDDWLERDDFWNDFDIEEEYDGEIEDMDEGEWDADGELGDEDDDPDIGAIYF
jgi:hypothetical protein